MNHVLGSAGKDGLVTFHGQVVRIDRSGRKLREFSALFFRGQVRSSRMNVPLDKVETAVFTGTSFILRAPGHVRFLGGKTKPSNLDYPLTVRVAKKSRPEFAALAEAVNAAVAARRQTPQA